MRQRMEREPHKLMRHHNDAWPGIHRSPCAATGYLLDSSGLAVANGRVGSTRSLPGGRIWLSEHHYCRADLRSSR